jgi:hypothetical protein
MCGCQFATASRFCSIAISLLAIASYRERNQERADSPDPPNRNLDGARLCGICRVPGLVPLGVVRWGWQQPFVRGDFD